MYKKLKRQMRRALKAKKCKQRANLRKALGFKSSSPISCNKFAKWNGIGCSCKLCRAFKKTSKYSFKNQNKKSK